MYVSDRSADSICDTALLFLVMKSEYMPSHLGGIESTSVVRCVACLYIATGAPIGGVGLRMSREWWVVSKGRGDGEAGAIRHGGEVMARGARCRGPQPLLPQTTHTLLEHLSRSKMSRQYRFR
jgi:hypothetical protein